MSENAIIGLASVVCLFGLPVLWGIVYSLANEWRKARVAEQNAVLKREMIERGFTADEIERVIAAGSKGKDKIAGESPQHAGRR
jgi:hypothetical protein